MVLFAGYIVNGHGNVRYTALYVMEISYIKNLYVVSIARKASSFSKKKTFRY